MRPVWTGFLFLAALLAALGSSCCGRAGSSENTKMTPGQSTGGPPGPPALPSNPSRPAAPVRAALVETREDGRSLLLFDMSAGQGRRIDSGEENPESPLWSPDGSLLLYRAGSTLFSLDLVSNVHKSIMKGISPDANKAYDFSPDGKLVAALVSDGVALISVDRTPVAASGQRHLAMPSGCKPYDLLWSADSRTLFTLCYPRPGHADQLLVRIEISNSGRGFPEPVGNVNRFLGWKKSQPVPVVASSSAGIGEDAGTLAPDGRFQLLHKSSTSEPESVRAYLREPNLLALTLMGEDTGEATRLRLASLEGQPTRVWLDRFPRLRDLVFSRDGSWAMFIDTKRFSGDWPGGDAYLVAVGSEDAKVILKGEPNKLSYSSPTPWP